MVLGLGPNLFYNSPMEACIVVCRMKKPRKRKGKIQFINAVNDVTRERAQSFLTNEHIEHIVAAYESDNDEPGFSRLVPLEDIRGQGYNLSIPLYVRTDAENGDGSVEPETSVKDTIKAWQASSRALRQSMDELFTTLKEVGIGK